MWELPDTYIKNAGLPNMINSLRSVLCLHIFQYLAYKKDHLLCDGKWFSILAGLKVQSDLSILLDINKNLLKSFWMGTLKSYDESKK